MKKLFQLVYGHVYIILIMVILISQNKITDFFMILAWASPFKYERHKLMKCVRNKKTEIFKKYKQHFLLD